jgi:hypothetical protein
MAVVMRASFQKNLAIFSSYDTIPLSAWILLPSTTSKGFERVQVKGGGVRDFVPLHRDARKVLDDLLEARKDG